MRAYKTQLLVNGKLQIEKVLTTEQITYINRFIKDLAYDNSYDIDQAIKIMNRWNQ